MKKPAALSISYENSEVNGSLKASIYSRRYNFAQSCDSEAALIAPARDISRFF
jgi:hypothetical protein